MRILLGGWGVRFSCSLDGYLGTCLKLEQCSSIYIPRRKYIKTIDEIANCPDCDELLAAEKSTAMLYGKSDIDEAEFMSNLSGSHFCHNCPVVVFEKETIEHAIKLGLRIGEEKSFNYDILGLVNLDAVPKEKKSLEFGTEDNPIPIVRFLSDSKPKIVKPLTVARNKFGRKVGRNESCPCASGKNIRNVVYKFFIFYSKLTFFYEKSINTHYHFTTTFRSIFTMLQPRLGR
ncbi:MAG: hypothetical protein ACI94Y_001820 [Maribacter sp.]